MIRKLYFGTFFTLAAAALIAQPTIEFEDFGLEYGTQVSLRGSSGPIAVGESGEDQTWDYSGLNPSGNITLRIHTIQELGGQPAAESYPTATHVFQPFNLNTTDVDYKRYGDGVFEMLGIHYNPNQSFTPDLIDFSDPFTIVEFPLTYGSTFSDTYAHEQSNSFEAYIETGEFTATVDAWGTLILPSGTFENVLRLRYDNVGEFTTVQQSSGNEETVSFTETMYAYYTPGIPSPLVRRSTRVADGFAGFNYIQSGYYDGTMLSTDDPEPVETTLLYPSPTGDVLQVELELKKATDVRFDVFDMSGKRMLSQNNGVLPAGKNTFTLSVAELAAGTYLTVIQTPNGNITEKFVVQR